MRRRMTIGLGVIAAALLSFLAAGADDASGPDMRDWWDKSSLAFDPLIDRLLYRFEIEGSFTGQDGKANGKVYGGRARIVVRKHRFTNYAYANKARQDVTYFGMEDHPIDTEQFSLGDNARYDILRHVFAGVGVERHRDTLLLIDNRLTRYAGLGLSLDPLKNNMLNVFVGYGRDDVEYMRNMLALIDPGAKLLDPNPSSDALFWRVRWTWQISAALTFREDFAYLNYSAAEMGERWNGNAALEVALMPHLSLSLGYTQEYDNNDVVKAFGIPRRNTIQTVGAKISY